MDRFADWIAVDWGTSRLRLWALDGGGRVRAAAESGDGMSSLTPEGYEPALLALAGPHLAPGRVTEVVVCGMAGARQGWTEAPYRPIPCPPAGPGAVAAPTRDPRLLVRILPGLSQAAPPDVMRGEETQIAGFLAGNPEFDGVLCLPGTHTKWARISAGEVVSFQTMMTGELFALLSEGSVLRHSVGTDGQDPAAFAEAVNDAMTAPHKFAARLFALRAGMLLSGLAPETARSRLSGLLIGLDLAAARPYWLGQRVAVVGAEGLGRLYGAALAQAGAAPEVAEAGGLTLAGLAAARRSLAR